MTQLKSRPESGTDVGEEYLTRAKALAPLIIAESATIEEQKDVTQTVVDALKEAELFWMLVPSALGGGGLTLASAVEVLQEISRADGSTGWAFMANSIGNAIAAGYLPAEGAAELFGGADKAITCGYSAPVGTATEVEGGIRAVAPHMQFGSGSSYATHIGAGLRLVDEAGQDRVDDNGTMFGRFAYVPREKLVFHGNWNVIGMVGTGSVDYEVPEQFIPSKFVLDTFSTTPNRPEGVYAFGLFGLSVVGHVGVVLGMAERALEEIAGIAVGKTRSGHPTSLDENPVFRHAFAVKEAEFQAARAYTLAVVKETEEYAAGGGTLTAVHHARIRQVSSWVHLVVDGVVSFAQLWGGSQAIRKPTALGRASQDLAVAKTHLLIDQQTIVDAAGPIIADWHADYLANVKG